MIDVELTGTDTATACGLTVKGRGMAGPIGPLARELLVAGHDGSSEMRITRAGTVCFEARTLDHWAGVTAREGIPSGARFYRYQPFDAEIFDPA